MEKDYSLLHPFDLEAAKRGEKFAFVGANGLEQRKFIAGPDSIGMIVIQDERGMFQESGTYPYVMAPLAWVEGKPVYRGDVLYLKDMLGSIKKFIATSFDGDKLWSNTGWMPLNLLFWQKPKTKREGWVNVYPGDEVAGCYHNKETADEHCADDRIACIKIEWEQY